MVSANGRQENRLLCPLVATPDPDRPGGVVCAACATTSCAWWLAEEGRCAIPAAAAMILRWVRAGGNGFLEPLPKSDGILFPL